MADELKPCPFGNHEVWRGMVSAGCPECGIELPHAAWNTRPIEDALRAEVAKYRGMEVEDAALRNDNEALRAEVAELKAANERGGKIVEDLLRVVDKLKAELAKYTVPLTDNQVASLADDWALPSHEFKLIDAAIRRVRRGE